MSSEEFAEFRDRSLIDNVVYLYLNQHHAVDASFELGDGWTHNTAQTRRSLDFAGCALNLLGCADERALERYFEKHPDVANFFGNELFNANGQMKPDFVAFVNRAIEHFMENRNPDPSSAG